MHHHHHTPTGETPLTCASYCGHYAAVQALLQEGNADVNMARQDGTTPLNLAAYADAKTALLLLDSGARPDTTTSKNSPFPVPLVMSAARGDVELCTRLIQVRLCWRCSVCVSGVQHQLDGWLVGWLAARRGTCVQLLPVTPFSHCITPWTPTDPSLRPFIPPLCHNHFLSILHTLHPRHTPCQTTPTGWQ